MDDLEKSTLAQLLDDQWVETEPGIFVQVEALTSERSPRWLDVDPLTARVPWPERPADSPL